MDVLRSSSSVLASSHFLAGEPHCRRLSAPFHLPRSPSRRLFDASRQRLLRIHVVNRVAFLHDSSENSRRALSAWSDKDLARAVLLSFLGRNGIGAGGIADLDLLVDLLASKLQPLRGSANPAGIEFTVLQLEDAMTPYLDSLLKEHGEVAMPTALSILQTKRKRNGALSRKQAIARLDTQLLEGILPPYVFYLMCFGLNLNQIRKVVQSVPNVSQIRVERKLASLSEFFLGLGMNHSDLPTILHRSPQLLSISIEKNLVPTVACLENLCIDKSQMVRIIRRYPGLLNLSRTKLEENISYFLNEGISTVYMGKIVARFPQILGIGINTKIKLTNEFFLDKGFTKEEIILMTVKFPSLHAFSLAESLVPKWEFFLVMGYPKSDLIKFPQYFSCSLKDRIMPRYKLATQHGVQLSLNSLLSTANKDFARLLEGKIRRCG